MEQQHGEKLKTVRVDDYAFLPYPTHPFHAYLSRLKYHTCPSKEFKDKHMEIIWYSSCVFQNISQKDNLKIDAAHVKGRSLGRDVLCSAVKSQSLPSNLLRILSFTLFGSSHGSLRAADLFDDVKQKST